MKVAGRFVSSRFAGRSKGAAAMSTLSLHLSPSAVARRARRGGWFARFIASVQESRMRTAHAEIARHRHLLPAEFEVAGDRLDARSEHQLPFTDRD
jgi:hypothetical protein